MYINEDELEHLKTFTRNDRSDTRDKYVRYNIINDVLGRQDFIDQIKNDPEFNFNKKAVAVKINKYAKENNLWKGAVIATIVKDLRDFDKQLQALSNKDPLDVRGNTALRRRIICEISCNHDFISEYNNDPAFKFTHKGLAVKINEYAIRHNLWSKGVAIATLKNDINLLTAELGSMMVRTGIKKA